MNRGDPYPNDVSGVRWPLVVLADAPAGWAALDAAIEIAARQRGRLTIVLVSARDTVFGDIVIPPFAGPTPADGEALLHRASRRVPSQMPLRLRHLTGVDPQKKRLADEIASHPHDLVVAPDFGVWLPRVDQTLISVDWLGRHVRVPVLAIR